MKSPQKGGEHQSMSTKTLAGRANAPAVPKTGAWQTFLRYKALYLMFLPVAAYYIIFHFIPMAGVVIAFQDYSPSSGISGSDWIGFENFQYFFQSVYFFRLLRNTLMISVYQLVFKFPASIILALLINEVKNMWFKRSVQTITYLPHFISAVIAAGIILDFFSFDGIINSAITAMGFQPQMFMIDPNNFYPIYVGSEIWQHCGWDSIIYLSALSAIDPTLYEAAVVDGAKRWSKIWHITLPGILPVIIIMLILQIGSMLSVGYEKILLLYNPSLYETADVISTYVYRKGLLENDYSFSTAIGLFNSVVNFGLLVGANYVSRKLGDNSLW